MKIEDINKAVEEARKAARKAAFDSSGQLSLGDIIDRLQKVEDKTQEIRFDFGYFVPTTLDSWRGIYAELAIGYAELTDESEITTQEFLELCGKAINKTFEGYKGGNYKMDATTPVWVAKWGEGNHTAVVDIFDAGWITIIQTRWMESS